MEESIPLRSNLDQSHFTVPRKPLKVTQSTGQYSEISDDQNHPSNETIDDTEDEVDRNESLDETKPQTRPHVFKSFSEKFWLVDVSSCVVALIALGAIVLILKLHQDQAVPNWPLKLTINALLSIFTTVLRGAIMVPVARGIGRLKWLLYTRPHALIDINKFDEASRGPWGSLLLFWRPGKHYVALLGALVTIAALAIDPFSQQLLRPYPCPQLESNETASVSKTNWYNAFVNSTNSFSPKVDAPMAGAIYAGLIDASVEAASSVNISCPTGSCTFQDYDGATHSTLAICHKCNDISNTVISNNAGGSMLPLTASTLTIGGENVLNISSYNDVFCGFSSLMTSSVGVLAVQCSIYPCVRYYRANISDFVLQEPEIGPSDPLLPGYPSGYFPRWSLAKNTTLRQTGWEDCRIQDHYTDDAPVPVFPNGTVAICEGAPDLTACFNGETPMYYPSDCTWVFDEQISLALTDFFPTFFDYQNNNSLFYNDYFPDASGSVWLDKLWENGIGDINSVNDYVENLAGHMTGIIRTYGETNSTGYLEGVVWSETTCVGVRWEWISLPAAIVFLVIVFLVATMVQTAGKNMPQSWKSSSLALLFHGLSDELRERYRVLEDIDAMEDEARQVRAQLGTRDAGWLLVERT